MSKSRGSTSKHFKHFLLHKGNFEVELIGPVAMIANFYSRQACEMATSPITHQALYSAMYVAPGSPSAIQYYVCSTWFTHLVLYRTIHVAPGSPT